MYCVFGTSGAYATTGDVQDGAAVENSSSNKACYSTPEVRAFESRKGSSEE